MQTKSYEYNEAVRDIEKYSRKLTIDEVTAWLTAPIDGEVDTIAREDNYWKTEKEMVGNAYMKEAWDAHNEIEKSGAFPYNSDVSKKTMDNLGINYTKNFQEDADKIRRMDSVVYNTNRYMRALQTVNRYHELTNQGYIPIADITEYHHKHKAILLGKKSYDWMTIDKTGEKVTMLFIPSKDALGHELNKQGYQSKGQRTKYHVCRDELFFKLV